MVDFISRVPVLKHILWLYFIPMLINEWFQEEILGKNMTAFWNENGFYMNRAFIIIFLLGLGLGVLITLLLV